MKDALDELESIIRTAQWFTRLGQFDDRVGMIAIRNLEPWSDDNVDAMPSDIADDMEWLPTTLDAEDPVYHGKISSELTRQGRLEEASKAAVDLYRTALLSLRRAHKHPLLVVGPHDFTKAARGAALFAVRQAALERVANIERPFWRPILSVYHEGFWPCGLVNGRVVVL